jgi:hypothetical protein
MIQFTEFTTDYKTYTRGGAIERDPLTLGYHFINTGSDICYLNNIPLYPSGVFDTMYVGYKDVSNWVIRWNNSAVINPELTVITFKKAS